MSHHVFCIYSLLLICPLTPFCTYQCRKCTYQSLPFFKMPLTLEFNLFCSSQASAFPAFTAVLSYGCLENLLLKDMKYKLNKAIQDKATISLGSLYQIIIIYTRAILGADYQFRPLVTTFRLALTCSSLLS